jgi:hypothetical protein
LFFSRMSYSWDHILCGLFRVLHFLRRHSTTWVKPLAPFAFIMFRIRPCFYDWVGLDLFTIPISLRWQTCTTLPRFFSNWDGLLWTSSLSWPLTLILLISSGMARITGVSHQTLQSDLVHLVISI